MSMRWLGGERGGLAADRCVQVEPGAFHAPLSRAAQQSGGWARSDAATRLCVGLSIVCCCRAAGEGWVGVWYGRGVATRMARGHPRARFFCFVFVSRVW